MNVQAKHDILKKVNEEFKPPYASLMELGEYIDSLAGDLQKEAHKELQEGLENIRRHILGLHNLTYAYLKIYSSKEH